MQLDESSSFEIFDVCAGNHGELQLLVHIEGVPGEVETYRATVIRCGPDTLSVEYTLDTWARTFWQSPTGTLYVADLEGGIHSNPGGRWIKTALGKQHALHNVWGLSDERVYCSGADAQFFRKAAAGWEPFNENLQGNLYTIGGTAENDLYVLGEHGLFFYHDGKRWSEVESPTNGRLVSVLCLSPSEVYFSGWKGSFFRFAEGKWLDFSLNNDDLNLYTIAQYGDRVFVGSDEGGVFLFDGQALIPFAPDIEATGLRACGGKLFAFGMNILQGFDGEAWRRRELDFSAVIPAQLP